MLHEMTQKKDVYYITIILITFGALLFFLPVIFVIIIYFIRRKRNEKNLKLSIQYEQREGSTRSKRKRKKKNKHGRKMSGQKGNVKQPTSSSEVRNCVEAIRKAKGTVNFNNQSDDWEALSSQPVGNISEAVNSRSPVSVNNNRFSSVSVNSSSGIVKQKTTFDEEVEEYCKFIERFPKQSK
ncbi:hypothetical protein DICVIV_09099 [Dictyocaulus viviparus]|uniref:Uncharacterized protein n=1 Tax=Dictyocaulus viviparus TaxID=29172 RepID=A0A0D8XMA6_DICVI|nr:hypothetical protein DICVIV_09099 [Dictyocaulus viviparus]